MKPLAPAFLCLMNAGATFSAEPSPEPAFKCNDAGTQQELNACARDAFEEADRKLNETYQALIRKESADKIFIARLRQSQKAWIQFRDAELEAIFACEPRFQNQCWGSMYPLDFLGHKKRLTDDRRAQLQLLLDQGRP
jgi:uncharacterized protein YecT (DUF1311 family)